VMATAQAVDAVAFVRILSGRALAVSYSLV
jgi:hypothetical protein